MKIETKEITITKAVYIADDGREFFDKLECEAHEASIFANEIQAYDEDLNKTTIYDAVYVNLITEADVVKMKKAYSCRNIATTGITKPGIYMYDAFDEVWTNLDNVIFKIRGGLANDKT